MLASMRALWMRLGLESRGELPLLITSVLSAVAFAAIACCVAAQRAVYFDRSLALAIHRADTPALDLLMKALTDLGSFPVRAAAVLAMLAWALYRRERRVGGILVLTTVATEVLNLMLKEAFARPRPSLFHEIPLPCSYSFPSGHAMTAAAVYGLIAVIVVRFHPRLEPLLGPTAMLFVLLVGLSRVYLGVHWPTDVLAGFAAGAAILCAAVIFATRAGGQARQRPSAYDQAPP
jgi:membrane-associated phospholipid phosphatase